MKRFVLLTYLVVFLVSCTSKNNSKSFNSGTNIFYFIKNKSCSWTIFNIESKAEKDIYSTEKCPDEIWFGKDEKSIVIFKKDDKYFKLSFDSKKEVLGNFNPKEFVSSKKLIKEMQAENSPLIKDFDNEKSFKIEDALIYNKVTESDAGWRDPDSSQRCFYNGQKEYCLQTSMGRSLHFMDNLVICEVNCLRDKSPKKYSLNKLSNWVSDQKGIQKVSKYLLIRYEFDKSIFAYKPGGAIVNLNTMKAISINKSAVDPIIIK